MVRLIISFFLLLSLQGFGQYSGITIISSDVIKKNNVLKCIEYDKDDSLNFFKTLKNGYYHIFDKNGSLIEQNIYPGGYDTVYEMKVLYVNDNKGKNIMWLWYDEHNLHKISRVVINEYDTLGNETGYRDFMSGAGKDAYRINRSWSSENPLIVDSVITNKKKTYYCYKTKDKIDTTDISIEYYTDGRFDSSEYHCTKPNHARLNKFWNTYKNGCLYMIESNTYNPKGILDSYKTYLFYENGLPKEAWYRFLSKGKWEITHTGFIYYYYNTQEIKQQNKKNK